MPQESNFGWVLVVLGLFLVGIGLIWVLAPSIPWLGRLPGDIRIETGNTRIYIPLMTSLLLSVLLSLLLSLIRFLRG